MQEAPLTEVSNGPENMLKTLGPEPQTDSDDPPKEATGWGRWPAGQGRLPVPAPTLKWAVRSACAKSRLQLDTVWTVQKASKTSLGPKRFQNEPNSSKRFQTLPNSSKL
jgi:hypothetical protein